MRRGWGAVLAWLWLALPAAVLAEPRHVTTAQFLLQDEAAAAAPDLVPARGPPGDWQSVALPHAGLQRRVVPDPQAGDAALAWYRLDLDAGGVDDPVLYLPRWQTVGRLAVYGDGKLLYRSGGSAQWSGFNRPVWLPLAAGGAPPATLLLLRISSLDGAGAGLSTVWVGAAGELRWRYELRRWLQQDLPYLASAVFLALGLFALGVWAVRRKESIYGLFFAASVVFYLRCLHYHAGPFQLLLDDEWFSWLTITSVGWLAIASYFFAFRLHGRAYPRSERAMLAGMGALTAAMLPVWQIHPHLVLLAPLAYLGITVVALFACLLAVWGAWRARSRDGLVLACWNLAAIPVAVHDMLLQNYRLSMEHVYLLPYTGIGMFVIFLYVAYRRYVNALAQAAGAQATLQRRLAERERELERSHRRLREIERTRILAGERERLMQDMHDGLGSSLVSALRMVQHGNSSEGAVAQVLQECLDDLRLTIDSLEPAQTDLALLLATLRFRLGPRLQAAGLALDWRVGPLPPVSWLTPPAALHVLRILQEVFTNILKHARARRLTVSTRLEPAHAVIAVIDDGAGFRGGRPAPAAASPGRGLSGMQARIL
ncbi:7TM diverse intracellular signaling [Bordetella pertussis CHLA-15]|nr:7TM diverse intracellular signaling [Bordetella pertussis CHLA-15]